MLQVAAGVRVYLACKPIDMRKGFGGFPTQLSFQIGES